MIEIKDIAQYEDNDSELAKYTIATIEEENKRLNNIINKAIDYLREIEMFEKKFGFDGVRRKKLLNILQGNEQVSEQVSEQVGSDKE